jgi:hypothetical protein
VCRLHVVCVATHVGKVLCRKLCGWLAYVGGTDAQGVLTKMYQSCTSFLLRLVAIVLKGRRLLQKPVSLGKTPNATFDHSVTQDKHKNSTHTTTVKPNSLLIAGSKRQDIVYRCECVSLTDKATLLVETHRHLSPCQLQSMQAGDLPTGSSQTPSSAVNLKALPTSNNKTTQQPVQTVQAHQG